MRNVTTEITGTILTIKVDLSQPGTPSSTGKTTIVASTQGNANLGNGFKLGLNLFK